MFKKPNGDKEMSINAAKKMIIKVLSEQDPSATSLAGQQMELQAITNNADEQQLLASDVEDVHQVHF